MRLRSGTFRHLIVAFFLLFLFGCASKRGVAKAHAEWASPASSVGLLLGTYANEPTQETPDRWPDHSLFHLLTTERVESGTVSKGLKVRISQMPSGEITADLLTHDGHLIQTKTTTLEFVDGFLISDRKTNFHIRILYNVVVDDQIVFAKAENGNLLSMRTSYGTIFLTILPIFGGGGGAPVVFEFTRLD